MLGWCCRSMMVSFQTWIVERSGPNRDLVELIAGFIVWLASPKAEHLKEKFV
jgi:hypothetical protein